MERALAAIDDHFRLGRAIAQTTAFGDLPPDGTRRREGPVLSDPAIGRSTAGGAGLARLYGPAAVRK